MRRNQAKTQVDSIVKQLSEERKRQGLSHEKLAQMCELHRSAISLIEARKREATLLTLLRIADALGCNLGQMISRSAEDSPL